MKVYLVAPLSKDKIEQVAEAILSEFDPGMLAEPKALDVLSLIDPFLMKKYGWSLDVREDLAAGTLGLADPKEKTISLSQESYERLAKGDGRSRFSGCHEFGHVALHRAQMRFRMITMTSETEALYRTERSNLKPFEDPEWQADYLAGCLLMPRKAVFTLSKNTSKHELVEKMIRVFQVSKHAAEVRLKKLKINIA